MRVFLFVLAFVIAATASAQTTTPQDEAVVEARVKAISKTLRCVVCQNQSIYDSSAPLAADMRTLVEKRVRAGDSDEEVREHLRTSYGDFVLMRPPVETRTWILWFGPAFLVVAGLAGLWWTSRRGRALAAEPAPLSDEDQARVDAALGRDPGKGNV